MSNITLLGSDIGNQLTIGTSLVNGVTPRRSDDVAVTITAQPVAAVGNTRALEYESQYKILYVARVGSQDLDIFVSEMKIVSGSFTVTGVPDDFEVTATPTALRIALKPGIVLKAGSTYDLTFDCKDIGMVPACLDRRCGMPYRYRPVGEVLTRQGVGQIGGWAVTTLSLSGSPFSTVLTFRFNNGGGSPAISMEVDMSQLVFTITRFELLTTVPGYDVVFSSDPPIMTVEGRLEVGGQVAIDVYYYGGSIRTNGIVLSYLIEMEDGSKIMCQTTPQRLY